MVVGKVESLIVQPSQKIRKKKYCLALRVRVVFNIRTSYCFVRPRAGAGFLWSALPPVVQTAPAPPFPFPVSPSPSL